MFPATIEVERHLYAQVSLAVNRPYKFPATIEVNRVLYPKRLADLEAQKVSGPFRGR